MRIPAFIIDHPVEGLIAGILLLALLFGSADRHAAEVAAPVQGHAQKADAEKRHGKSGGSQNGLGGQSREHVIPIPCQAALYAGRT